MTNFLSSESPRQPGCSALLLLLFAALVPLRMSAEIIAPERLAPWKGNVGVPGGIPTRTTIFKNIVTDLGADPTGVQDCSKIIADALAACPPNQVVYIPEGTFLLNDWVRSYAHRSNFTLRGAGQGATILKSGGKMGYLVFGNSQYPAPNATQRITAGATKGSNTITVPNTDEFYVGFPVGIAPALPKWAHNLTGGSRDDRTMRVTFRVVSKTATTVTFEPPCPFDFSGMDPYAQPYYGEVGHGIISGVGIEDLTIDLSTSTAGLAIEMNQAWGCWIQNVEIKGSNQRQVRFTNTLRSEVRRIYVHGVRSSGPNHEGVTFDGNCCWNLVEDSIFSNGGAPPVLFGDSQGANACNVVGYNFVTNTSGGFWDMSSNHSPHNMLNLFEGNMFDWYKDDGYFGSSSHNTLFRNRIASQISLKHFSNYYNVVGNVIGSLTEIKRTDGTILPPNTVLETEVENYNPTAIWPIYELGYPNIGNQGYTGTIPATDPPDYTALGNTLLQAQQLDHNVKATLFRHGNFDFVTNGVLWDKSNPDRTIPDSLYYESRPSWWPSGVAWPPIGPDRTPMVISIPAADRYNQIVGGGIRDTSSPSPPSNLAAVATSSSGIALSWTASTDNVGVAGYRLERSEGAGSTAFGQVGTSATTAFSDGGLTASTTYNYRVRATDNAGNLSVYSAVSTVTTPGAPSDTIAPTVPTNLSVTSGAWSATALTWEASIDNIGVTGYRVERSLGSGSTAFAQIATPTSTSFADSGLTASTVYNYRVRAADAIGNLSDYSSVATITTGAGPDIVSPTVPGNITTVVSGPTQIDLSWSASADAVGVVGYRVERSEGTDSTTFAQIATPTTPSVTDGGLKASTAYNYRVRAVDGAGNLSLYSTVATASTPAPPSDTTAPSIPGSLSVLSSDSTSQLKLTWAASTDNMGVTGYQIERSQGSGSAEFTQVAVATAPAYDDQGLTAATAYNYRIRAVDAAGNLSGYSNVATATTAPVPEDKLPPTAPASLVAEPTGGGQITLSWSPASDNVSVIGYNVERSNDTVFVPVATSGSTTYADKQLTSSTTYKYRVRAVDGAGNSSDYSNIAEATTTSGPKKPTNLRVKGPK